MPAAKKSARPRTYWILRPDQIRCLASARRQEILDRLVATGPVSVRECAAGLGVAPSALYHHLHRLVAVGLVVAAGSRVVQRRTERIYAPVAPRVRLAGALQKGVAPKLMARVVASLARQMERDFAKASRRQAGVTVGKRRTLGFFRLVGAPDAKTLAAINRHLDQVTELLWNAEGPERRLVALGWVMAPVGPAAGRPAKPKRRPRA
jgi:DNA-binding transcriptional ArsR family regulator